jgi:hypothetical protein
MTTGSGLATSGRRRVTVRSRQRTEPARVDGRLLRAGDEGWDAVLIWNGTVAVVPEPGQDPDQRRIRQRG